MAGLFYFGEAFRPIPLEKHFIGVKGKPGSQTSSTNLDRITYHHVANLLRNGRQVMVFVHARRETMTTARKLHEMGLQDGADDLFSCRGEVGWDSSRFEVGGSKTKDMRALFGYGI